MQNNVNFLRYSRALCWTLIITISTVFISLGQISKERDLVENDKSTKIGRLKNGLTYMIRRISPSSSIHIQFIVKTGRNQETRDNLEIAHLIEHIPMNSTPRFSHTYNYFQSFGILRGQDFNASTSDDATVYRITIPSNNAKLFEDVLKFFRDCSSDLTFDPIKVNNEKAAVMGEFQRGNDYEGQLETAYLRSLMGDSDYAYQYEIDLPRAVSRLQASNLCQFYKTWYRPDNEGIIIVGDIEEENAIKQIKLTFSDLEKPREPLLNNDAIKNKDSKLLAHHFTVLTHLQQVETVYRLGIKSIHNSPMNTIGDLQQQIFSELFNEAALLRTGRLSKNDMTSVLDLYINLNNPLRVVGPDFNLLTIMFKVGEVNNDNNTLFQVIGEIERLKKYGFNSKELQKAKEKVLQKETSQSLSPISHFAFDLASNFVTGDYYPAPNNRLDFTKNLLNNLNADEFNSLVRKWLTSGSFDIAIVAPESNKAQIPDSTTVAKWIVTAKEQQIDRISESEEITLLSPEKENALITGPVKIKYLGSRMSEIVLTNGLKVLLKLMPRYSTSGQTRLVGVNPIGLDSISTKYYLTATYLPAIMNQSPVGSMNSELLDQFYQDNYMSFGFTMSKGYSGIEGSIKGTNVTALFQAFYVNCETAKPDTDGYDALVKRLLETIKANNNLGSDTVMTTFSTIFKTDREKALTINNGIDIKQVDFGIAKRIYQTTYDDISNFEFVLVSDRDSTELVNKVAKYLGNLNVPSSHVKLPREIALSESDHPTFIKELENKPIKKIIYAGEIPDKAEASIFFRGKHVSSEALNQKFNILIGIISDRLRARLKDEEGGIYDVSVASSVPKAGDPHYWLSINFVCSPNDFEKLIKAAIDEVNNIENRIDDDTFNRVLITKENELEKKKTMYDFWTGYLIAHARVKSVPLNPVLKMPPLTKQEITDIAVDMFDDKTVTVIGLMPLTKRPN